VKSSNAYSRLLATLLITAGLTLAGCNTQASISNAASSPSATEVSVITVSAEDTPIYNEYAAQTFARDMVEVRGRVDGYIRSVYSKPVQM